MYENYENENLDNDRKVKIYIGASEGISVTSKMIQVFQFGFPITHIFYVFDTKDKFIDPLVIEAQRKGVTYNNFSEVHHVGTVVHIYSIEVYKQQKLFIEKQLKSQVGKGYDFLGILGFLLRNKKIERKNRQFCSELIYKALEHVGIELFNFTKASEVSPQLFVKSKILKHEKTFILNKGRKKTGLFDFF